MRSFLVLAVVLVGCGRPASVCAVGGAEVESDADIDCGLASENWRTAREVLIGRGIVPAEAFDRAYGALRVRVRPERAWSYWGKRVIGTYEPPSSVEVNFRMESLAHEMLHHWQVLNGVTNSADHPGWSSNGYDLASGLYSDAAESVIGHQAP